MFNAHQTNYYLNKNTVKRLKTVNIFFVEKKSK